MSSLKLHRTRTGGNLRGRQLVLLTQSIGKSANEFLTMEGVSPEAVFLLGKDFELLQGNLRRACWTHPRAAPGRLENPQTRERLEALMKLYEQTRTQAGAILAT